MIYPKEGSVLNSNPAGLVDAPWVTDDDADAARQWVEFLRDDDQQQRFMKSGFRPATDTGLSVDAGQFASWGLDANQPRSVIEPGDLQPDVLERIVDTWGAVKNPAIVTFVVDTSGSMQGEPIEQVKQGLTRLLDAIAATAGRGTDNQVGLFTFSTTVDDRISPRKLVESRFDIADAIGQMKASGGTALFDAIAQAVIATDNADGDPRATRAVVVLSDGAATDGRCLDSLVSMTSAAEDDVTSFCATEKGDQPATRNGTVSIEEVRGTGLLIDTKHTIQVFFLGFGEADLHIGRILAESTGAEFQGSTAQDLAAVIEALSGYF
jgi:Ca-activated chloride channel family protein